MPRNLYLNQIRQRQLLLKLCLRVKHVVYQDLQGSYLSLMNHRLSLFKPLKVHILHHLWVIL